MIFYWMSLLVDVLILLLLLKKLQWFLSVLGSDVKRIVVLKFVGIDYLLAVGIHSF